MPKDRRISVGEAAELIGRRFHDDDWTPTDPAMLANDWDDAPDREAWTRADHVEDILIRYVTGGWVKAYALADDEVSFTELPTHWVTHPSFDVRIRSGTFMVFTDNWEPLWIDGPELLAALPANGKPREKHSYEWDKIVNEGWMFALRQDRTPIKAEIVRHLGAWCPENRQAVPEGSQLAKVARTIVDFLTENKTRWKDLKMESVEADE